ncbi:hypothetical protein [Streptomyces sp. NPDC004728]
MAVHAQYITCCLQGHVEVAQGSSDVPADAHSLQEAVQRFGGWF